MVNDLFSGGKYVFKGECTNKLYVYYQGDVLLYVNYNGNTLYKRSWLITSNQMTLKPLKAYNLI